MYKILSKSVIDTLVCFLVSKFLSDFNFQIINYRLNSTYIFKMVYFWKCQIIILTPAYFNK